MLYIVRILAALCVLVGHLFSFLDLTILQDNSHFPYIQSIAVVVFFLLSGFLTDHSLHQKEESYSFSQYLKHHFRRIFGSFIPALVLIAIFDGISLYVHPDTYSYPWNYNWTVFLKNLIFFPWDYQPFGTGRPLWTLFYEWWLYILYGYWFLVCRKSLKKRVFKLWQWPILLLLVCIPFIEAPRATILAFALGVLVNRLYRNIKWCHILVVLAFGGIFVGWALKSRDAYSLYCPLLLAVILLEALALGHGRESGLSEKTRKALRFASGCTYPLYLIHYTLIEFLLCFLPLVRSWRLFWIAIALSVLLAILFYSVEQFISRRLASSAKALQGEKK